MQSDNHYRSICPDQEDEEIPKAWFEATERKPRLFYRAGAKSVSSRLSLPSSCSTKKKPNSVLSLPSSRSSNKRKPASVLSLPSASSRSLASAARCLKTDIGTKKIFQRSRGPSHAKAKQPQSSKQKQKDQDGFEKPKASPSA